MPQPIIKVENLGKKYQIGSKENYYALRDTLANPLGWFAKKPRREFWALKDINFEVMPGEAVGIIGRNGAGKSTLLKILSQITPPTTGKITMRGRVASLLEVGTGFHPELTGRENIFLNGAILGMTRKEIARKFDEIVAFAEIEKFLDTPVKRYSNGMYVRLAFAVAAHLEPEILLVDEVLAVGDIAFQKKCLGKMDEVAKGGRTIIFVSHNMGAIQTLCKKVIYLVDGKIKMISDPEKTIMTYRNVSKAEYATLSKRKNNEPQKYFFIKHVSVQNNKKSSRGFTSNDTITIGIDLIVNQPIRGAVIGIRVTNSSFMRIFTAQYTLDMFMEKSKKIQHASIKIPSHFLLPDEYQLHVAIHIPNIEIIDIIEEANKFIINPTSSDSFVLPLRELGGVYSPCQWKWD